MAKRSDFHLRPLEEADRELLFRWRNAERVRQAMFTDHLLSWEEHVSWFDAALRAPEESRVMVFEHRSRPLGIVTANAIDRKNGRCNWGFYLGETDVPRGSGTIMGYLGLRHLFETLGIRKVCGECFRTNERSVRFHERLGFSREGLFRRHHLKNDIYEDVVAFAMFRDDWPLRRQEIEHLCFNEERTP